MGPLGVSSIRPEGAFQSPLKHARRSDAHACLVGLYCARPVSRPFRRGRTQYSTRPQTRSGQARLSRQPNCSSTRRALSSSAFLVIGCCPAHAHWSAGGLDERAGRSVGTRNRRATPLKSKLSRWQEKLTYALGKIISRPAGPACHALPAPWRYMAILLILPDGCKGQYRRVAGFVCGRPHPPWTADSVKSPEMAKCAGVSWEWPSDHR